MVAVKRFEELLASATYDYRVHYANSSAIRLGNIYARHHVYCNRGVNGIEGSLSTAAGFAAAQSSIFNLQSSIFNLQSSITFCVIGDLSFFYDQNALMSLATVATVPRFRILLLNNGVGGIFDRLPGLSASAAHPQLVAGSHTTTAKGICQQYGVEYRSAVDTAQLEQGLEWLTEPDISTDGVEVSRNPRTMLLEVFTTSKADKQALDNYINTLQI
jgi:2-succinyl-5-enolpyruvyl-6-hydroxy-3-cyclohexene-1-carboxylate synthase